MVILTHVAKTPPSLPFQGTFSLCWLTPPSMFQMSKAMKIHSFWAVQLDTPFTRCARFKGKGMVDVSADAVLPPAGPAPSRGCIPTPPQWEKNSHLGHRVGEIVSISRREACPTQLAQVPELST